MYNLPTDVHKRRQRPNLGLLRPICKTSQTDKTKDMAKTKVVVRWVCTDKDVIKRIRERFKLPDYTTLNGFTPGMVADKDMAVLEETARRGFLTFELKEWSYNGKSYAWK